MPWLRSDELRVGLGCMRLSADEEVATATIAAAVDAGITVFDTARAYGNETLVARAIREAAGARLVTKGGMARIEGAWIPDGKARTIRADCEASLAALDGVPIDLFLLHAPDRRVAWKTTLRALAALVEDGLVARVGVCNVNRTQLDVAVEHAPISAVQIPLSRFDDTAVRGGVVERCSEHGLALIAHSPLGGPRRVERIAKDESLREVARARGTSEAEVALAWVLDLAPNVVAIPGARRPETARSAARAAALELLDDDRERLRVRPAKARGRRRQGDVVLVMGIQGAGKSRVARTYVERGYLRLNRDERGGTLRGLVAAFDEALESGAREVVLDNTYLARAWRNDVVETAARYGLPVRCLWLDTPLAQAQVNLVERLLDRFDGLPSPDELRAASRKEAGVLTPTQQMRALRELEPPGDDEGFASVEHIPFARVAREGGIPGAFVAAPAVALFPLDAIDAQVPHLVFDWRPDGLTADLDALAALLPAALVETAACTHAGGPPSCWCRPPLPGLPLAFARRHDVEPSRSVLIGTSAAHRTLANALGSTYVDISA
jgi:aryl-alcohol dehydrogenase-like predicted oxidoreductase/predicted kinase